MVDQAQDTLRPNNRLSDMQATMEQTQAFENRVLERLNAGKTVTPVPSHNQLQDSQCHP